MLSPLKIGTVHISNPRGAIVVFLSCKPWRTECSCVTYVLHIRLAYNSEQNCTGPITTRMAAKNQSHVSWRSIPRHFIRSFLRVQFHSCTFLNRENLLTVRGFGRRRKKKTRSGCWHGAVMWRSIYLRDITLRCTPLHALYRLRPRALANLTRSPATLEGGSLLPFCFGCLIQGFHYRNTTLIYFCIRNNC